MNGKAEEHSKVVEQRATDIRRAAADYALARAPKARRDASVATLRALWEIAAAAGAPIEGLAVVNKLIRAIEDIDGGELPSLFTTEADQQEEKKPAGTSSPDLALAAALVDALNQYERMPIQEAIDYVASKRGLSATTLKTARQRLRSKVSRDSGQSHYRTALSTIAAQSDPARAIRVQLLK